MVEMIFLALFQGYPSLELAPASLSLIVVIGAL